MSFLGPTAVVGTPDETARIGTASPYDFAYWAGTFVARGVPDDYIEDGPETDGSSLVAWATTQVGVTFPATFSDGVVAIADTTISVAEALHTRGAIVVNDNDEYGVCMGLQDTLAIVRGRYYIVKSRDFARYGLNWLYGAHIPGLDY